MDKRLQLYHYSTRVTSQKARRKRIKNKGVVVAHVPKKFIGYNASIIIYSKKREEQEDAFGH